RKANVDLSLYKTDKHRDIAKKKQRLFEINKWAAKFFQHQMINNRSAVEYIFKKRKINKNIVMRFSVGYAPNKNNILVDFLKKKGFTPQEISEAGLSNRFGGDLFKNRMMIPLMDVSGGIVGFTGRIIEDDPNAPKYLNTPQTLLYDKSWHVFGLAQAKESIRQHDYAVIVEGNLDVVSSHQAGINYVVATAGTAMTIHHLKIIGRFSKNIRLAFDSDKAGLAATERAISIAQEAGIDLSVISLPDYAKDPDELIQRDPKLWQGAIDAYEPAVDWILRQYYKNNDISTAAGKRAYTTAGLAVIHNLQDPVERDHYLRKMAEKIETDIEVLRAKMKNNSDTEIAHRKVVKVNPQHKSTQSEFELEDNLLALGITNKYVCDLILNEPIEIFRGDNQYNLVNLLKNNLLDLQNPPEYVKILLLRADARYAGWNDQDRRNEASRLIRRIKDEYKKQKKELLTAALRDAEDVGDDAKTRELLKKIQALNKEIYSR
ncbi:MAG: DNA primase, partial [Candidatus Saccharibacteria bacterium]